MALKTIKGYDEVLLNVKEDENIVFQVNHIFEPEYHQDKYVKPCTDTSKLNGAFQLGNSELLKRPLSRGMQPVYMDNEDDHESLSYEGMVLKDGSRVENVDGNENICVLKSNCVRFGFIDVSLARSVSRTFYLKNKDRAGVEKNDILINSTGDGTIGRVAVYCYDFPAIVDGHITIVRYKDDNLAWYVAAFLLTEIGQNQIYRYINGSSGQVEIYPQDLERIWIKPSSNNQLKEIAKSFKAACKKHDDFYIDLKKALSSV